VCAGLESLLHSIMSAVRLIDDQFTTFRERPLGGLSPELTHPFKSDKRTFAALTAEDFFRRLRLPKYLGKTAFELS
jgi:hypothetical protein